MVTDPVGSSVLSLAVATVSVTLPDVGTVTVRVPGETPKSPDCETVTVTVSGAVGGGSAVIVKVASPPSVMFEPAVMLTSGSTEGAGGGLLSHCAMA